MMDDDSEALFSMDPYATINTLTHARGTASRVTGSVPPRTPELGSASAKTGSKLSTGGRSGGSGISGRTVGSGNIDVMRWEVQYSDLKFKEILGKGSFGKVRGGPGPVWQLAAGTHHGAPIPACKGETDRGIFYSCCARSTRAYTTRPTWLSRSWTIWTRRCTPMGRRSEL